MKKTNKNDLFPGVAISVLLGLLSYAIKKWINSPIADPLLIALFLGITCRMFIRNREEIKAGVSLSPAIFLPVGIIFYGANNLNFAILTEINASMLVLLFIIMGVYIGSILFLGKILGQKKQITYLTAAGSSICGASAIAVTSPAIDADPDDISISLLSVAVTAFVGFSLVLPFLIALFDLPFITKSFLSGSILQFTGLVKVADRFMPYFKSGDGSQEAASIAISIKAVRYLGLIVVIPLFASMIKKKFFIPWFLWAFLAAGLCGTWLYVNNCALYSSALVPLIKPVHVVSWTIAMAAIGLNADIHNLFSNNGSKAILMAFTGFLAASITFFIGLLFI